MCLIALAIDSDRRFPLVVAANRDEFFNRPTARLGWWTPERGPAPVLGGRDLDGGGTWLGLTAAGRMALLTNVRDPLAVDPAAPSRGRVVTEWLAAREATDRFWMRTALAGHNGFNLLAADFRRGECFWASNVQPYPLRLERGVYGVSNAGLDTPWPKVLALKARLRQSVADTVAAAEPVDALATRLFAALADPAEAADADLPDTGVPLELERRLSAAHIRSTANGYGTRCATLVITEHVRRQRVTHVLERTFGVGGGAALLRRATLAHWPPRYTDGPAATAAASEHAPVADSELPPARGGGAAAPLKRSRVRTLLKPARK